MFGALRRCPTILSRNLSTAAVSSRILQRSSIQSSNAIRISSTRLSRVASSAFHDSAKWRQIAAVSEKTEELQSEEDGPITKFKDLATRGLVHQNIIDTITKSMRLTDMTDVQTRTINEALSGSDVVAQAKTGTGKTLGFLIPIVQRIINNDPQLGERARGYKRAKADNIRAIVISPTRELAEQIAMEAKKVTQGTGIVVQTAVGGTQKRAMLQKTQREGCHLLIGTPGRLKDILSDSWSGVKAPNLNALVMDEADRLLDDGFQQEIDEIKEHLPDPAEVERQTLMFSATVPRKVVELVRSTLRPGFHYAKCVNEDEEPTHQRVPQKVVHVNGFENIMPTLYELVVQQQQLARTQGNRPFKAIIYFNSTAEVTVAASVFFKLGGGMRSERPLHGLRGYEIHARLTQQARTRAADNFRFAKSGILFSSDVTARGMDFPDVTHVIQVGLPRDRESYIHRIGRTGRAGKEGEGWLLVAPVDQKELRRRLHSLPLQTEESLEMAQLDLTEQREMPENLASMLEHVSDAYKKVYPDQLEAAFRGLFGAYQWYPDKQGFLEAANRLAEFGWGMPPPQPPASFMQGFSNGRRGGGNSRPFDNGYARGESRGSRDYDNNRRGGSGGRSGGGFDRRGGGGGFGSRRGGGGNFGDRGNRVQRGGFPFRERQPERNPF